jgi:bifunctional DNA-binding transcriptional regulator/antitoxin component of YhaV-PrlF toxin-antitoxin module
MMTGGFQMGSTPHSRRPSRGSLTENVWQTADRISRESGRCALRREVIDAIVRAGGNANTASTQYSQWRKTWQPDASGPGVAGHTQSIVLQMGRDGRVLVPQAFRIAMGIDDSTKLSARVDNGELRIVPQKLAVSRLQALVKAHDRGQGSAVDELVADRRLEAGSS